MALTGALPTAGPRVRGLGEQGTGRGLPNHNLIHSDSIRIAAARASSAVSPLYAPLVGGKTNFYTLVAGDEWKKRRAILGWNHSMLVRRFEQTGSFLSEATRTHDVQPLDAQALFNEHARRDHDLVNMTMADLLYSHRRWAGVDLNKRR